MYEHKRQPLLPKPIFIRRVLKNSATGSALIAGSLGIGVLGYHFLVNLSWLDALLNASMILTGMGPIDPIKTVVGKLFASAYALFSGIMFLSVAGLLLAPVAHRFFHKFHLEMEPEEPSPSQTKGANGKKK